MPECASIGRVLGPAPGEDNASAHNVREMSYNPREKIEYTCVKPHLW